MCYKCELTSHSSSNDSTSQLLPQNQIERIKTIKSSEDQSGATDSLPKERSQLELEEDTSAEASSHRERGGEEEWSSQVPSTQDSL